MGRKTKKKKPMSVVLKAFLFSLILFAILAFIVCGVVIYHVSVNSVDYIDYSSLGLDFSSIIYYTDEEGNHHEYEQLYGEQNRVWASYDEIPQHLLDAFVAIEDERFYKHHGFDLRRTVKATMNYVFNKSSAYGGSTINQQIVKNITGRKDNTPQRKILEIVNAIDMDLKLDKPKILEIYANTIYLSQGCYGVKTAATKYFGKDVSELTLAECASIAGITQFPTKYDPLQNPENNKEKQELVLAKMLELGYISQAEHDEAVAQDLLFHNYDVDSYLPKHSYFTEQIIDDVIRDLEKRKHISREIAIKMIYSGGLQIYSTVVPDIQNQIDKVYANPSEYIPYNPDDPIQAAMVVIEQETGKIVGVGGGLGKKDQRTLNRASNTLRQPGSTIKPLSVYGPGFDRKVFYPESQYEDKPYTIGTHTYKNYYAGYVGPVTVRNAIEQSINTVAVQCLDAVTLATSYDYMVDKFNFTTLVPQDIAHSPLAVGGLTNGVSVLELTAAYSSIANEGLYIKPYSYTKVCDMDGKVILENKKEANVALSERAAQTTMSTLVSVVTSGTGTPARLSSGTQTAGKTGTTDDDKDRWFVGISPYYTAAVWVGYDIPKTIVGYSTNPALALWKAVMNPVHDELPVKQFKLDKVYKLGEEPEEEDEENEEEEEEETEENITTGSASSSVNVCVDSGLIPTAMCRKDFRGSRVVPLPAGHKVPTTYCNQHQYIRIDTKSGLLATGNCPSNTVITRIQPASLVRGYCNLH